MHIVRSIFVVTVVLTVGLLAAGCGADSSDSSSSSSNSSGGSGGGEADAAAGSLDHVDGTITVNEDELSVQKDDGDVIVLPLGPAVERGQLQTLVASQELVRVQYEAGGDRLVVSVAKAPTQSKDVVPYEGLVTQIEDEYIEIQSDEGTTRFAITDKYRKSLDLPHLKEHQSEGDPVIVYAKGKVGNLTAIAYEDA